MSTYGIVTIRNVRDRRSMKQYAEAVVPTFEGTGMKPLSIYQPFQILEGELPIQGMVLLEFPDMQAATRWYESPAYQAIRHYRLSGADSEIVFVDAGLLGNLDNAMPPTKGDV